MATGDFLHRPRTEDRAFHRRERSPAQSGRGEEEELAASQRAGQEGMSAKYQPPWPGPPWGNQTLVRFFPTVLSFQSPSQTLVLALGRLIWKILQL